MNRQGLLRNARQRAFEIVNENIACTDGEFRNLRKLSPELAEARLTLTILRESYQTALAEVEEAAQDGR